jgi:hypothetical protein
MTSRPYCPDCGIALDSYDPEHDPLCRHYGKTTCVIRRQLVPAEVRAIHLIIDAEGDNCIARHGAAILAVFHAFGFDPIPEGFRPGTVAIPNDQWTGLSTYCSEGSAGSRDLLFEGMMLWVNIGPSSYSAAEESVTR